MAAPSGCPKGWTGPEVMLGQSNHSQNSPSACLGSSSPPGHPQDQGGCAEGPLGPSAPTASPRAASTPPSVSCSQGAPLLGQPALCSPRQGESQQKWARTKETMQDAKLFQMSGFATVLPRALLPRPSAPTACSQPGRACALLLRTPALAGWQRGHAGAGRCPCSAVAVSLPLPPARCRRGSCCSGCPRTYKCSLPDSALWHGTGGGGPPALLPRLGSARPRTEAPFIGCAARAGRESEGPGTQHPRVREPQCHLCPGATRTAGGGPAAQRLRADTARIHGSSGAGGGAGTRPPPARPTKPAFRAASGRLPRVDLGCPRGWRDGDGGARLCPPGRG